MRYSLSPRLVLVRSWQIVVILAIVLPLIFATPVAAAIQDDAIPPPVAVPGIAKQKRLLDDVPVLLDRLGRVPVGRITFEPGATLSPQFFVVPLFAVVEEGTFEVGVDGVVTNVGSLDQVEIEADSRTTVENVGSTTGSLIAVAQLSTETFADFTLWGAPEFELAPGVVTNALALRISMQEVLAPKVISVDLLDIPTGVAVDSLDFAGSTATESLVVVVVKGAITPNADETISAGQVVELYAGDTATEWRVTGAKPARLLIFRLAAPPDD